MSQFMNRYEMYSPIAYVKNRKHIVYLEFTLSKPRENYALPAFPTSSSAPLTLDDKNVKRRTKHAFYSQFKPTFMAYFVK
eukprot:6210480-Pleurochrysis_carterae.AAC.1